MDPRGDLIGRINAVGAPTAQHHALAANDLVVPTLGVSQGSADPAFPIADDRVFNYTTSAGVLHTSFFGKPETSARLLSWLPG